MRLLVVVGQAVRDQMLEADGGSLVELPATKGPEGPRPGCVMPPAPRCLEGVLWADVVHTRATLQTVQIFEISVKHDKNILG